MQCLIHIIRIRVHFWSGNFSWVNQHSWVQHPNHLDTCLYHCSTRCFISEVYLHICQSLADRATVVLFVLFWSVANHTDGLIVLRTEKLELLPMKRTELPRVAALFPLRFSLILPSLVQVRLAQVLQGEARYGVIHRLVPAHRAVAGPPGAPVLLQAEFTEAMAALEDHRVSEDIAAYGTGQVDLREREPTCHPDTALVWRQKYALTPTITDSKSTLLLLWLKNVYINQFLRF